MKLIILAFIISISLHLFLFNNYKEKNIVQKEEQTQNNTKSNVKFIKLKSENTTVEKNTEIKKQVPKEKIVEQTIKKNVEKVITKKTTNKDEKKLIQYEKKKDIEKAKIFQDKIIKEQIVDKEESIQSKTLENFLSQRESVDKKILSEIERLYGREFETFTKVQKAFLEKNLNSFQTITQRVLNRLGYPRLAAKLRIAGTNIVEFMFYPDGSIKELKITSSSGYEIFDEYTLELIQIAYKDYPRPETPTKLKFNVQYRLY